MPKQKIKAIVNRFLKGNDPEDVKESLQEMYHLTMMSEHEISSEDRQSLAYYCREMIDFLNELSDLNKTIREKIVKNSTTIITFFAFLLF